MKFITKQELDNLLTQLIDVLFVEERSFESIIGEFENDDELVQKAKVILFFSPIYYPKNVMISKMMHRNKFLCRIKIENIWREEMIQKRDYFYDLLRVKPVRTSLNERKIQPKALNLKTDYFSFYIDPKEIPDKMEVQDYANTLANSFLIRKLFPSE